MFENALENTTATTVFTSIVLALLAMIIFSVVAAASWQIFAVA